MSVPKAKQSIKTAKTEPKASNQELEERLKRALADYHNLEKRIEEERKLLSKLSASLLIEKLLPILDNLESAQLHLEDQGLRIVIKQFKDVLTTEGVEEIKTDGMEFDPHIHEAIETQEGAKDNTIVKVVAKGYKIDGTVLRPAKVVVSRSVKSDDANQDQNKNQSEMGVSNA